MAILLAMAVALLSQEAQAVVPPTLHERPIYESEDNDSIIAAWKHETTGFPADATGFYRFHDEAQGVRIVSRDGEISGYLLKFGKGSSDKDLVLGYLFSDVAGNRDQMRFTTRQVHGIWYGFQGQVIQRRGWGHTDNGNYILEGTLTMHDEIQQTTEQDTIKLHYDGQK